MTAALYQTRVQVPEGGTEELSDWWRTVHGPGLIEAGFFGAHHYRSTLAAEPVANSYEIPGVAAFGPRYQEQARIDFAKMSAPPGAPGTRQTIYLRRHPAVAAGAPRLVDALTAPVLVLTRFDAPGPDAVLAWYEREELPRLRTRPGFVNGFLAEKGPQQHPTSPLPSEDQRWAMYAQWANRRAADDDVRREPPARLLADGLGPATDVDHDVLLQQACVLSAGAWAP